MCIECCATLESNIWSDMEISLLALTFAKSLMKYWKNHDFHWKSIIFQIFSFPEIFFRRTVCTSSDCILMFCTSILWLRTFFQWYIRTYIDRYGTSNRWSDSVWPIMWWEIRDNVFLRFFYVSIFDFSIFDFSIFRFFRLSIFRFLRCCFSDV